MEGDITYEQNNTNIRDLKWHDASISNTYQIICVRMGYGILNAKKGDKVLENKVFCSY